MENLREIESINFMQRLSLEGKILLLVCLTDCLLSFYFVQTGLAIEINPVMKFLFDQGTWCFVIFKICWSFFLIYFLELLYKREPKFARKAMRLAVVLYLAIITLPNLLVLFGRI